MKPQFEKEKLYHRRELIHYLKKNYNGLASVNKLINDYKKAKAT